MTGWVVRHLHVCSLVALLPVVATLAGCADDNKDREPDDAGMDASMEPPPSDTGGDGDGDGVIQPSPRFMCGALECRVPGEDLLELFEMLGFPTGPIPFSPCCTEEDNACGLVVLGDAGMGCVPRPPSDDYCPDVDIFGVLQPGCCIEEAGICGVNAAQVGAGCVDSTGGLGPLLGIEPVPCGAELDAGNDVGDGG